MNYFAHGRAWLAQPLILAGTALPDWLSVIDRKARLTRKRVEQHLQHAEENVRLVAQGVLQHLTDDKWFHSTSAFAELSHRFTRMIRGVLSTDDGMRPWFLGHILVEMLLDCVLMHHRPQEAEEYYRALEKLPVHSVQKAVETLLGRPMPQLGEFIRLFWQERFLFDYSDDGKLLTRLNQVMRRVGLPVLPPGMLDLLPVMRQEVAERQAELLAAG